MFAAKMPMIEREEKKSRIISDTFPNKKRSVVRTSHNFSSAKLAMIIQNMTSIANRKLNCNNNHLLDFPHKSESVSQLGHKTPLSISAKIRRVREAWSKEKKK